MAQVLIGIQARSGSKRLPGKSLELIDDAIMVEHVMQAAKGASYFINAKSKEYDIYVSTCLLIPYEDRLREEMAGNLIIEGPEDNVLARYGMLNDKYNPDFIVRITGDCPLLIPAIISKHIITAYLNKLDYCSNSFDELRTYVDGYDVEVISKNLMNWLLTNATTRYDKEHVTTLVKRDPPPWAKFGAIIGYNDFSDIKFSVDTKEELDLVRKNRARINEKLKLAKSRGYYISRF